MTRPMRDPGRIARAGGLLAWTVALAATIWFLDRLGRGALAPPPLGSMGAVRAWTERRDAAEIVMAVVRLVALVLTWYLVALTVAGALLRLFRPRHLVAAADRVTPAWLRSLLDHAVGVGLTGTVVLGAVLPSVVGGRPPPLELAGAERPEAEGTASQFRLDGTASQRRLAEGPRPAPALDFGPATLVPDSSPVATVPRGAEAAPDEPPPSVWVIAAGDHLWRVAEETLIEAQDGPVTDRRVAVYWRELIELNRGVLVDPDNPDLVYPGQVFALPPPSVEGPQGR